TCRCATPRSSPRPRICPLYNSSRSRRIRAASRRQLTRLANGREELVEIGRLGHVARQTQAARLLAEGGAAGGCDDRHGRAPPVLQLQLPEVPARDARHRQIQQHDAWQGITSEKTERRAAVTRLPDDVAIEAQQLGERLARVRIVVDE